MYLVVRHVESTQTRDVSRNYDKLKLTSYLYNFCRLITNKSMECLQSKNHATDQYVYNKRIL